MENKYIGLIFECPHKNELELCPFKPIRELTLRGRFEFYKKLPTESRSSLIESHLKCSSSNF